MPHNPAVIRRGGVYWHVPTQVRVAILSADAHNLQPWRGRVTAAPMTRTESSPFAVAASAHDEVKGWIDVTRMAPVNVADLAANPDDDADEPLLSGATLDRIAWGINRYLGLHLR